MKCKYCGNPIPILRLSRTCYYCEDELDNQSWKQSRENRLMQEKRSKIYWGARNTQSKSKANRSKK